MDNNISNIPIESSTPSTNDSIGFATNILSWFKTYWMLFPLLLLAIDFYWVLWGNIVAIISGIVLMGIVCIDFFVLKQSFIPTLRRYWTVIVLVAIISLSMYIRLFGYFTPDGNTRWPYLRNIDSYFFYRQIGDIIENNGILPSHDNLMISPEGIDRVRTSYDLYYYVSAYGYYFFRNFLPEMSLQIFLAWFPALLASLIVIPAYYIGKKLYDRKAGVLAALFMVFTTPFMARSLGGDPDSDGIVMLMLILSIATYIVAYKNLDATKIFSRRNIIYSAVSGLCLALFAFSWGTYWIVFTVIFGFVIFKIIADILLTKTHGIRHIKEIFRVNRSMVGSLIIIIIIFYLITVSYFGVGFISNPITSIFGSLGGAASVKGESGTFPNVYVSVAEMQQGGDARAVAINAAGLETAASITGLSRELLMIISPFILTLACFAYLIYSYYKRREHLDTLIFMLIWFALFLFASTFALRATIFLAPVYAICSGIVLAKLWRVSTGEDSSLGA